MPTNDIIPLLSNPKMLKSQTTLLADGQWGKAFFLTVKRCRGKKSEYLYGKSKIP
jgi:hypothetical protein